MKKLLAIILCAVMCLSLAACGAKEEGAPANNASDNAPAATPEPTPEPFEPLDWTTVPENPASDFTYENIEGEIRITGYTGTNPVMRIPETIDGMTVKWIAEDAFRENEVITHAYIPDCAKYPEARVFIFCSNLKQARLPEELYTIEQAMFKDCTSLRMVNIPGNLNTIGSSAFENCRLLTSIELPESVESIKQDAFKNCRGLQRVYAPGVKWLGQVAFADCKVLSDLTLPGICNINGNSFNGCDSLASITLLPVPDDYEYSYLIYENGILYSTGKGAETVSAMRMLPGTPVDELVLRDNTTAILHSCFYGCQMKSVVIPASVRTIEGNAFKYCENLESFSVSEGSSLYQLDSDVFHGSSNLKTVDLSNASSLNMYSGVFFGTYGLEKVILPDSITASETAAEMFSTSSGVTVTYRGSDYTSENLANLVFAE